MNEHPACVTRRDGTVDDGETDSFWRDFATRVAQGRKRVVVDENETGARREKEREGMSRAVAARERIMNRLFISFSSVKLLRMVRP